MIRSISTALFAFFTFLVIGVSNVNASTVEVKLGTDAGMLAFEPSTLNISAGDTVKFVNNKLAPHNAVFDGNDDLSHPELLLQESLGRELLVLLEHTTSTEPHRGAGMVGKIVVN